LNAAEWLPMLAVAAMVLVAATLLWTTRAERERLRRLAPVQARVAVAKAELGELDRRVAAGEIAPEDCEQDRRRIASSLLESTAATPAATRPSPGYVAGALAVAVVAAGAVHLWSSRAGDRSDVRVAAAPAAAPPAPAASGPDQGKALHALSDEQLQHMVDEAGAQVKKSPTDTAAWAMLAHSYDMLGKFAESSKAYATLARLLPKDAQVLADYADALAVANGRTLAGEPTDLVKRALAIDPKNLKALALSGTAAYERSDFPQAVTFWERALAASPDPAFRQQIETSLLAARSASSGGAASAATVAVAKPAPADPATPGASVVAGRVTLADDLVAKASPDATVYIFARPAEGSRMPVALMKKHVRDLPVEFSLDDGSAMVPDVRLSQVQMVVIGARISKRGDVTPQPGDMQGWSAPVRVGTRGIRLEISEVLK
jgi:cytochrome c-type biogenesis protein CcmH